MQYNSINNLLYIDCTLPATVQLQALRLRPYSSKHSIEDHRGHQIYDVLHSRVQKSDP